MEAKHIYIVKIITKKLLIYHHQYLLSSTGRLKKVICIFKTMTRNLGSIYSLRQLTFQLNKYRRILIKKFVSILSIAIYLNYLKPGKQIGLKLEGRLKDFHQSAIMRHQLYKKMHRQLFLVSRVCV